MVPARQCGHGAQSSPNSVKRPSLNIRTRKLIGTIVLLVFLAVYAFIAMLVAVALQVNASKWVEPVYYTVAGLAWVIPAGRNHLVDAETGLSAAAVRQRASRRRAAPAIFSMANGRPLSRTLNKATS